MDAPTQEALLRIQVEYIEMPDLKLTRPQIRRLCNLADEVCGPALTALVNLGFLRRTPDGQFMRRGSGPLGAARPLSA